MLARRVAQDDRIRLDLRGRAGVNHGIVAGLQVERHGVAHDGEVLVVNGERRLGGRGDCKQRPGDQEDWIGIFHGNLFADICFIQCRSDQWHSQNRKLSERRKNVVKELSGVVDGILLAEGQDKQFHRCRLAGRSRRALSHQSTFALRATARQPRHCFAAGGGWCRWSDSNRHDVLLSQDFKSCASAISPHRQPLFCWQIHRFCFCGIDLC